MTQTRTIFIPSAGRGTRLSGAGTLLPKPLLSHQGLPIIARIIDLYPLEWNVVIAIGHEGDLVRDSVESIYRNSARLARIRFFETDSYKIEGMGLTNTLLDARPMLQERPFVFHACDSLMQPMEVRWTEWIRPRDQVLISAPVSSARYRYLARTASGDLQWHCDWVDAETSVESVYVGVAHVFDTEHFWARLLKDAGTAPEDGECLGLDPAGVERVTLPRGQWFDTGSAIGLQRLNGTDSSGRNVLPKVDEAIWFTDSHVIKVHKDPAFIEGRVERANYLWPFVPRIDHSSQHTYAYQFVQGHTLSSALRKSPEVFPSFLAYLLSFWFGEPNSPTDRAEEGEQEGDYFNFYHDKTYSRTRLLTLRYPNLAEPIVINNRVVPALNEQLGQVDWLKISKPLFGRVHGDLHPENVLVTSPNTFLLLDWRQDMAGSRRGFGDVYYDLSKLAHGLRVDHEAIARGEFGVSFSAPDHVSYYVAQRPWKSAAYEMLRHFCEIHDFDWKRVLLMEALVYLNIATLHNPPEYSKLLAVLGRDLLDSVSRSATDQ